MSMTIQRQAKTNNNNKKMDFENYDGNGVQTNRSLRDIYHFTMYNCHVNYWKTAMFFVNENLI